MPHNYKLKKIKVSNPHGMDMPSVGKHYSAPNFYVDAEQMPEIKNWEVGKEYYLVVKVEQKSKNEREDSVDASFDIISYKHLKEKTIDEMSDREFGEHQSHKLAGY